MALQKVKKSLIWDKGLDTKTNPKITEGYLQLENCQVNNVTLEKTKGLEKITEVSPVEPNNNIPYTINIFSTFNQLEIVSNNRVYEYDPLSTDVFDRGSFAYLTSELAVLNIESSIRQYYSEYGDYGALCYLGYNAKYRLKVQNLKDNIVIVDFETNLTNGSEYPVGIISTQVGYFLYTQQGTNGQINEYFYTYNLENPFITSLAVVVNALDVTQSIAMEYPFFKTISLEYDGANIWIFSVLVSGDALVTIRNNAGATITTIVNAILGVPPNNRTVTNLDFRKGNLNSFFWNKSDVVILQPGPVSATLSSTIWAQFNETICVFNTQTQSFIYSFTLPGYAPRVLPQRDIFYFSQSIAYLQDNNSLYVLQEDLSEYVYINTGNANQVFPYVIAYRMNSNTNTWQTDNINFKQPKNYTFNPLEFGQGFATGSLWPTENNMYFCALTAPYATNAVDIKDIRLRHSNYYVLDFNYNLVDFIVHYNAAIASVVRNITSFFLNIVIPISIVESKENRVTGKIPYVFIESTGVDNRTLIFDMGIDQVSKLVSADRGQTGYFGISNMYMATQSKVEYAQFLDFPTLKLVPSSTATLDQFYTYAATFEYVNQNGELVRTTPSVFKSVSVNIATDTVQIYYTYPCAIESKNAMSIKLWRTTLNTQTFYLLTTISYDPGTTPPFFTDSSVPDTTLIDTGVVAYFNGGVLGEIPFDPFTTFTSHQNTIFAVTREDQNIVQYSLPNQPTVTMATAFGLSFTVSALGGPIIELASLDEKLIILKENYLFVTVGQGADALGNNSTLTIPELITSPVGCSEKASVVRIPEIPGAQSPGGIMFKSSKGIYLLDRALSVKYIGASVEAFNSLTIISTALAQNENKCRFTTLEGVVLTYDYYYDTWDTEVGINLISTTTHSGNFVGVDRDKQILQMYDGYYKNNKPYTMTIATPWIKMGGLQGYQRVYKLLMLGDFKNSCVVSVGIMYDFVDQIEDWLYFNKNTENAYGVNKWGALNPYGGVEKSNFEIQFNIPKQKCQSIRFIIKDEFDSLITDTGNSFTLTELAIIAGVKSESVKLPVPRRV